MLENDFFLVMVLNDINGSNHQILDPAGASNLKGQQLDKNCLKTKLQSDLPSQAGKTLCFNFKSGYHEIFASSSLSCQFCEGQKYGTTYQRVLAEKATEKAAESPDSSKFRTIFFFTSSSSKDWFFVGQICIRCHIRKRPMKRPLKGQTPTNVGNGFSMIFFFTSHSGRV